jgi:hypothetical protein
MAESSTFFDPVIYLKTLAPAIEFYKKAFDAIGEIMMMEAFMLRRCQLMELYFIYTKNGLGILNGTTIAIGIR